MTSRSAGVRGLTWHLTSSYRGVSTSVSRLHLEEQGQVMDVHKATCRQVEEPGVSGPHFLLWPAHP